ncbi:MazG family protein, partial [Klebsiella pneumoniae]|nr:MazG family protein [Klebsiella pneumoniae]
VVLVDDRLGDVVPAAAVRLLRGASAVYAESGVSGSLRRELGATEPRAVEELLREAAREPVVLVAGELSSAESKGLSAAGAPVVSAPAPTGMELLDAVAVMDRLRSPGGCPWDAQQDHRTLRKYLVEETYELLDAIAQRDRGAMREELGDVLLQVLFHARVAAEDEADPFDIDEVAAGLVGKLVSRHPNVFAEDGQVLDAESQHARWEELKQQEKQRDSIVDGVALGQPAVALAAKLVQRASRAGVPVDELDFGGSAGEELFAIAARAKLAGAD